MFDWRVQEGEGLGELPVEHRRRYELELKRSGYQLYVDIAPAHGAPEELNGVPQMSLFVEVNEGVPCVHISNALFGDQVLTVFALEDGLYLRPDATDLWIRTGIPTPGATPGLARRAAEETEPPFGGRSAMNHAFIVTK